MDFFRNSTTPLRPYGFAGRCEKGEGWGETQAKEGWVGVTVGFWLVCNTHL